MERSNTIFKTSQREDWGATGGGLADHRTSHVSTWNPSQVFVSGVSCLINGRTSCRRPLVVLLVWNLELGRKRVELKDLYICRCILLVKVWFKDP